MKRRKLILGLIVAAILLLLYWALGTRTREITLTGLVTTDEVIVSSEIQGRVQELRVKEGDTVTNGQLLALIQPREWKADVAYYASSERQSEQQVAQAGTDLEFEELQTSNQIRQAEANWAAAQALVTQALADQENARLNFTRLEGLYRQGVESAQTYDQARTAYKAARAHVDSVRKQAQAAQSAVALARSNTEQVLGRKAALEASRHRLAAAGAQKEKAEAQLDYTEIRAAIDGMVDLRAALAGEVVNPGQGIVTLINPDDLWVRADVEESYIDRIRLGDRLSVRLPSGARARERCFIEAWTPITPRSGTSAAPSGTSRRSKSGSAATTAIVSLPWE